MDNIDLDKLDLQIVRGAPAKPAFVFIHGLGMTHLTWTNPPEARMMGGMISLRTLLKEFLNNPSTLWHDLKKLDCTAISWSQRRPVGPASDAVDELECVLELLNDIPCSSVILVGHSRGGLVARSLLNRSINPDIMNKIKGLITICSPHSGSGLARWATTLGPAAERIKDALPTDSQSTH